MRASHAIRPCCGHSIEVSIDGYCTLLTCDCICRAHCRHLQVTVPGDARREERLRNAPLYGWCRACRLLVDDAHIRCLRPQRDPRMAIYWLGEDDLSEDGIGPQDRPSASPQHPATQLPLFS